jgi:hypothetical protein
MVLKTEMDVTDPIEAILYPLLRNAVVLEVDEPNISESRINLGSDFNLIRLRAVQELTEINKWDLLCICSGHLG